MREKTKMKTLIHLIKLVMLVAYMVVSNAPAQVGNTGADQFQLELCTR